MGLDFLGPLRIGQWSSRQGLTAHLSGFDGGASSHRLGADAVHLGELGW